MPENLNPCKLITITELASLFMSSTKTIRRMVESNRLPKPFRLPGSTVWRWKETDIAEWINNQKETEIKGA